MQMLIRLPEDLGERFRQAVPARKRSLFVAELLSKALPMESDPLYQIALAVENDEALTEDMSEWGATLSDGLAGDFHEAR